MTGVDDLAARTDLLVRQARAAVEEAAHQSDVLEQYLSALKDELWGGQDG